MGGEVKNVLRWSTYMLVLLFPRERGFDSKTLILKYDPFRSTTKKSSGEGSEYNVFRMGKGRTWGEHLVPHTDFTPSGLYSPERLTGTRSSEHPVSKVRLLLFGFFCPQRGNQGRGWVIHSHCEILFTQGPGSIPRHLILKSSHTFHPVFLVLETSKGPLPTKLCLSTLYGLPKRLLLCLKLLLSNPPEPPKYCVTFIDSSICKLSLLVPFPLSSPGKNPSVWRI